MSEVLSQWTVGFLGAGQMATALAQGGIRSQTLSPTKVVAADPVESARQTFEKATGARTVASNSEVVDQSDLIVLAVKPQSLPAVLQDVGSRLSNRHLVVSIAAGVTLSTLSQLMPASVRLIRVMPNTPCLLGAGASAYALGATATPSDAEAIEALLTTVGRCARVPEHLLDAVTGLSGSGPAFVYQFIEALSDGGVRAGLPRALATELAAQTVLGAAQMVLTTGLHTGALKDAVASPGGTTIAGLHALEQGGLRGTVMNAVVAAWERSRELSQG